MSEKQPDLKTIERRGRAAVAEKAARLERLKIEYVPTDSIKPNEYNPNRQSDRDFELLLRSMREEGFDQPIVVNPTSRMIVDGEHRWRAARHLGLTSVPVVFIDMTAEQMRISTLRHNRARGSEDVDLASQVLKDLRELGALDKAQEQLMLSDAEIERIISDVPVAEALASEEFSGAWVPTKNKDGEMNSREDRHEIVSSTPAAEQKQAEMRAALNAAPDQKARELLEKQQRKEVYRLQIHLTGEEAELARRVLEPKPAVKILELCMARELAGG